MQEMEKEKFGEIILYQTEDGLTKIDVKIVDGTLWLTQMQIAELFGVKNRQYPSI